MDYDSGPSNSSPSAGFETHAKLSGFASVRGDEEDYARLNPSIKKLLQKKTKTSMKEILNSQSSSKRMYSIRAHN
jgi:hypothetical protein